MPKTKWADVEKGDRVELGGKVWTVVKAKRKGASVKVTVRAGAREASSVVEASAKVKRAKAEPLHDRDGRQQRWAKPSEVEPPRKSLAAGDPAQTKPPSKLSADPWESPRDRIEKKLDAILGARLVGETNDEASGYYVPPPDVTTIASHMALFHPNTYDAAKDEATMLAGHAHEHKMVLEGKAKLGVNHWHTETRPKVA